MMSTKLSKMQREILSAFAAGECYRGRHTNAIQGLVQRGLLVRNDSDAWDAPSFLATDAGREALTA